MGGCETRRAKRGEPSRSHVCIRQTSNKLHCDDDLEDASPLDVSPLKYGNSWYLCKFLESVGHFSSLFAFFHKSSHLIAKKVGFCGP